MGRSTTTDMCWYARNEPTVKEPCVNKGVGHPKRNETAPAAAIPPLTKQTAPSENAAQIPIPDKPAESRIKLLVSGLCIQFNPLP